MCKYLTKNTNKLVCWYFDPDEDEIEIYTENSNFEEAMKYLDEFENGSLGRSCTGSATFTGSSAD